MSIYAKVNKAFDEYNKGRSDDFEMWSILDALSPEELSIWIIECELDEELRPEHGMKPDFYEIVEREIYARGIEQR